MTNYINLHNVFLPLFLFLISQEHLKTRKLHISGANKSAAHAPAVHTLRGIMTRVYRDAAARAGTMRARVRRTAARLCNW